MAIEKAIYTAQATSTGGRTGTTKSSDGRIELQLSTPKALGGDDGPGTNPEQLFASGYSACFIGAMKAVAARQKISLPEIGSLFLLTILQALSSSPDWKTSRNSCIISSLFFEVLFASCNRLRFSLASSAQGEAESLSKYLSQSSSACRGRNI